jgi:hypothetical protein
MPVGNNDHNSSQTNTAIDMKEQIIKVARDLEQGTITEDKARSLLLGLLGSNDSLQPLTIQRVDKMLKDISLEAFIASGFNKNKWEEWWRKRNEVNVNSNDRLRKANT